MSHQCSRMGTRCSRDHCPLQNGTSWPGSSSDFATQKHANGHGWAVWKEVNQIREFYNAGLSGNRENQDSCDQHSYQSNQHQQNTPHNNSNSTHVPMDVDNTTATIPFQKLTDNKTNVHNTVPKDNASGVDSKDTLLETAQRTQTHEATQPNTQEIMPEKQPLIPPHPPLLLLHHHHLWNPH